MAGVINQIAPGGRCIEIACELAAEVAKTSAQRGPRSAPTAGIRASSSAMWRCKPLRLSFISPTISRRPTRAFAEKRRYGTAMLPIVPVQPGGGG